MTGTSAACIVREWETGDDQIAPGSCKKIAGMVKFCLKIYSACNSSVPLQLRAKIYSGPAVRWDY